MQVKAVYESGVIDFLQPTHFKCSMFEVAVNIPEAKIEGLSVGFPV